VEPATFDRWAALGLALGIGHVEAGPLTRSSYHASQAADAVGVAPVVDRSVQVALSARPA
jgi:lipoic acid synthetase